jgi:hypothetical protein
MRATSAVLITLLGLLLINYNQPSGVEHHQEWADEVGLPGPADWQFRLGQLLTPLGGIWIGLRIAARRRRSGTGG